MDLAREFGLAAQIIEKDYMLGWLLAGISANPEIGSTWVFKGGTCLKKCYFETYRFSEDLDFTLTNPDHLDEAFLIDTFNQIADWIYDNTGIEIPRDTIRFDMYENPRGNPSAQGRIGYRGPMLRGGDAPRIKLDITNDELLVLNPVPRDVHHPYTDRPEEGIQVLCYAFEEVFAEKIRALAERERPRDLYDVVHLYRHDELKPDQTKILDILGKKCEFKGIDIPTMETLLNHPDRDELETEWENMLGHQLPALPEFEQFWNELPAILDWLHGVAEKVSIPAIHTRIGRGEEIDRLWHPPSMSTSWSNYGSTPLEIIRFAAANRLCVDLDYTDQNGRRSSRLIEPYSLHRTLDDKLYISAIRHEDGQTRSYRADRINEASVSDVSFIPKHAIEMTPVSTTSMPKIRGSSNLSSNIFKSPIHTRRKTPKYALSSGPKYIHRCTICSKTFTRKTNSSRLNPHKNKSGYPCPGRTGIYVKTKYR